MSAPTYAELAEMPARLMSLGLALSWQAAREPDRIALTMGDQRHTRIGLDRLANRLARMLAAKGVKQDDRVVILLPTGPSHQISAFAIWKLGATAIPLSTKLVDAELEKLIEMADPMLVIGAEPDRVPGRATLPVDFEIDPALPDHPLPEIVAKRWKAITSGGSTGMPKLLWENRDSLIHPERPMELLMYQPHDVVLHPATAYHNSPFCQSNWGLAWGFHVVLMQHFDAVEWLRQVELHRVRWAYLVPTMMSRILALPDDVRLGFDLSSLDVVMHMAAPCPPWVKAAWIDWLGPEKILEIYAGTEGYGTTLLFGHEWLAHPGTVGKAPPGTEIRGEDGCVLPTGEIGMIYMLPPNWSNMGLSQEHRTYGDMGWLDADDYLYLADRRTDMIVSGGGNLYPAEIEAAIEQFPGVVAAAVIGLPDDDLGSVAHGIIEMAAGATPPEPRDLSAFLRSRLTLTKHPRSFETTNERLRDDTGKMRRSRLREVRLKARSPSYRSMR